MDKLGGNKTINMNDEIIELRQLGAGIRLLTMERVFPLTEKYASERIGLEVTVAQDGDADEIIDVTRRLIARKAPANWTGRQVDTGEGELVGTNGITSYVERTVDEQPASEKQTWRIYKAFQERWGISAEDADARIAKRHGGRGIRQLTRTEAGLVLDKIL